MTGITIQSTPSEHWQPQSQDKGLVFAQHVFLSQTAWPIETKHIRSTRQHTGKLFPTRLVCTAGAARGEGKLWDHRIPQGSNLGYDFKSTETPQPPLQERILHVYKFIYGCIHQKWGCAHICIKIHLKKFISASKSWASQAKLPHHQPSVLWTVPIQNLSVGLPSFVWSKVSPEKAALW